MDPSELLSEVNALTLARTKGKPVTLRVGHSSPYEHDWRVVVFLADAIAAGVDVTIDGSVAGVSAWWHALRPQVTIAGQPASKPRHLQVVHS